MSCLQALASLQASRKCNKIKGCVLSSRAEGTPPPPSLVEIASRRPGDKASKPRPSEKISSLILTGLGSAMGWAGYCGAGKRGMISPSKQCLLKFDLDRSQPRSLFTLMKMEGTNCPWKAMSQTSPRFRHVPGFVSNPNRGAFLRGGLGQLPQ